MCALPTPELPGSGRLGIISASAIAVAPLSRHFANRLQSYAIVMM